LQALLLYYTFLLFFTIERLDDLSTVPEQQKINLPPYGINYVQRLTFLQQVSRQNYCCRQWKENSSVHCVQIVTVEIQMQKQNPCQCSFYKQKQRHYFTSDV